MFSLHLAWPQLVLLVSVAYVFSPQLRAQQGPNPAAAKCGMSVLSLNLHGVRDAKVLLAGLQKAGRLEQADLMLFQEVVRPPKGEGAVDQLARSLGLQVAFARGFTLRNGDEEGLAVLSRFPVVETRTIPLKHYNLLWKSRRRIALAVTVEAPGARLYLYNIHLDTRLNLRTRLEQLRPIADEAAALKAPVLLGGDLNTNPYRWVEHTLPLKVAPDQGKGLLRFMERLGFTSALQKKTPTSRYFRMQLDWLFLRKLQAGDVSVKPIAFSDHHALQTCLATTATTEPTAPD